MFFIFPGIVNTPFNGIDTLFDLDIAFISDVGEIVDIRKIHSGDPTKVISSVPFKFALEVNEGWFEHHGISVGHRVIGRGTKVHII
jgi:uncharacterized membrane protein (UPF0127 family)